MSGHDAYGFETLAVHAGARPDPTTGARSTPIFRVTHSYFRIRITRQNFLICRLSGSSIPG